MMKTNDLPGADLTDLIFAQRNRDYGAYILRREYPKQLARGLMGAFSFVCFFSLALYLAKEKDGDLSREVPALVTPVALVDIIVDPPPVDPAPPAGSREPAPTVRDLVPVVVPDETRVEHPVPTVEELSAAAPGFQTQAGDPHASAQAPSAAGAGPEQAASPVPAEPVAYDFQSVEQPAVFPGGTQALRRFLEQNLRDPRDEGAEPGSVVRVQVKFIIATDGQPGSYELMQSGGEAFDREVMRVLRKMPRWTPARQNQRTVPMYFILPVSFAVRDQD